MTRKTLYPPGTRVRFQYSWFARTNRHHGHECEVVESHIKRPPAGGRVYYKYILRDLTDGSVFKTEDAPPIYTVTSLAEIRAWKREWAKETL